MKNILKFIISVVVCELAGIIGSFFTTPAIRGWYIALNKPSFNPPNWVFGPVWTMLFFLMGVSLFLIWRKRLETDKSKNAILAFTIQLALNVLWSIIFFGLKSPSVAFVEILILWMAIFFTIRIFAKISKPAAWLLVPYILWVSFAIVLNFAIWRIN